jgi:hypothetical protein
LICRTGVVGRSGLSLARSKVTIAKRTFFGR